MMTQLDKEIRDSPVSNMLKWKIWILKSNLDFSFSAVSNLSHSQQHLVYPYLTLIPLAQYFASLLLNCLTYTLSINSVQFSRSVVSDSLRPYELQFTRPPCPSPTPGVHPNSCPSGRWCHPAISSSVVPFSSCMLLSRFSRVRLCATPETAAHQAPPSLGFSRQEHWSGLPFPSPKSLSINGTGGFLPFKIQEDECLVILGMVPPYPTPLSLSSFSSFPPPAPRVDVSLCASQGLSELQCIFIPYFLPG